MTPIKTHIYHAYDGGTYTVAVKSDGSIWFVDGTGWLLRMTPEEEEFARTRLTPAESHK